MISNSLLDHFISVVDIMKLGALFPEANIKLDYSHKADDYLRLLDTAM